MCLALQSEISLTSFRASLYWCVARSLKLLCLNSKDTCPWHPPSVWQIVTNQTSVSGCQVCSLIAASPYKKPKLRIKCKGSMIKCWTGAWPYVTPHPTNSLCLGAPQVFGDLLHRHWLYCVCINLLCGAHFSYTTTACCFLCENCVCINLLCVPTFSHSTINCYIPCEFPKGCF